MIIPDNETSIDLLCFESIATSIVEIIKKAESEPLTIGVHGDWGAGKSSILLMVKDGIESNSNSMVITFNGWLFQGFENAKIVIIETIIKQFETNINKSHDGLSNRAEILNQIAKLKKKY